MSDALEVWLDDAELGTQAVLVGYLSRARSRGNEAIRFRYAEGWLSSGRHAFAIDPELALTPGEFFPRDGRGLHGVFRDCAPDRWGRVLMERREAEEARLAGRRPRRLSEWDFLAEVSDAGRMGALRLRDAHTASWIDDRAPGAPPAPRLRELETAARSIDEPGAQARPEYAEWLRMLVVPGSSLGGARPKASFADPSGALWLAKFPANDDRHDVGALEFVAHQLAKAAGLVLPDARLESLGSRHHTFCAKRFDRANSRRRAYASAMTLVQRDDGETASYLEIAEALQREGDASGLEDDLGQLYLRIAFSILIGNRDDHLRNHGFLRAPTGWRLAPAFDINPSPDKREHALAIDESDPRPDMGTLRSTARFYRLDDSSAARIEARARNTLKDWHRVAAESGLGANDLEVLAEAIDPSLR